MGEQDRMERNGKGSVEMGLKERKWEQKLVKRKKRKKGLEQTARETGKKVQKQDENEEKERNGSRIDGIEVLSSAQQEGRVEGGC